MGWRVGKEPRTFPKTFPRSNREQPIFAACWSTFRRLGWLSLVLGVALSMGCVRSYQPLRGLHDPLAVDPTLPNFSGVALDIACVEGPDLPRADAAQLCARVGNLFENQGADVRTSTGDPRVRDETPGAESERPADLQLEIRSRTLTRGRYPWSWALCSISFTIVPAVRDFSFSQELIVRDPRGFVLAQKTLEGRIVESWGAGIWVGNKVLDWTTRDKAERMITDSFGAEMSADMYGQLTQLVFNSLARSRVTIGGQAPRGG